jgi:hypothetical protein
MQSLRFIASIYCLIMITCINTLFDYDYTVKVTDLCSALGFANRWGFSLCWPPATSNWWLACTQSITWNWCWITVLTGFTTVNVTTEPTYWLILVRVIILLEKMDKNRLVKRGVWIGKLQWIKIVHLVFLLFGWSPKKCPVRSFQLLHRLCFSEEKEKQPEDKNQVHIQMNH